jgi:integrase/recombinase XerD
MPIHAAHSFRHTVATLMLENGADTRVIREMFGHAKISTRELYTCLDQSAEAVVSGHASRREPQTGHPRGPGRDRFFFCR